MTTENSDYAGGGAGGLTADEVAFFESGGESGLNTEAGSDNAGGAADTNNGDGSNAPDGGDNSADKGNKGGDKTGEAKHVPLAALQEERTKRKALGDTVKSLETQLAEFRGKFSILERLGKQPAAGEGGEGDAPAGPPNPREDIFAAFDHVAGKLGDLEKQTTEEKAAAKAREEAETADRQFVSNYRNDAAQFEAKTPDFKPAYNFLLASRAQELIRIGYDDPNALAEAGADDAEVHAARKALHDALMADERGIAELAFSKKKSPAEIIYGLAQQRGYKKDGAKPGGDSKPKGDDVLDTIERGQAAHKSLSNTGGGSGEDAMTAERLISMPLAEFEAWTEKNPAAARRILGG
jgi:hypothetical protein